MKSLTLVYHSCEVCGEDRTQSSSVAVNSRVQHTHAAATESSSSPGSYHSVDDILSGASNIMPDMGAHTPSPMNGHPQHTAYATTASSMERNNDATWICTVCTYENVYTSTELSSLSTAGQYCEICETERPRSDFVVASSPKWPKKEFASGVSQATVDRNHKSKENFFLAEFPAAYSRKEAGTVQGYASEVVVSDIDIDEASDEDQSTGECEWEEEVEPSEVDDRMWTEILSSTQDASFPIKRHTMRDTRDNKDGRVVATDLFIDLTCDITERKHHRSVTSVNTQDPLPVPARIPVSAQ